MNPFVMSISFVECDRPLFVVRALYCGSIEQEGSYLVKMLLDSVGVEFVCVRDEQDGVCFNEKGLFDYLLGCKCEGRDVRKAYLCVILLCGRGNLVVVAFALCLLLAWCLCGDIIIDEKFIPSYQPTSKHAFVTVRGIVIREKLHCLKSSEPLPLWVEVSLLCGARAHVERVSLLSVKQSC